jgi:hypothetical protein
LFIDFFVFAFLAFLLLLSSELYNAMNLLFYFISVLLVCAFCWIVDLRDMYREVRGFSLV